MFTEFDELFKSKPYHALIIRQVAILKTMLGTLNKTSHQIKEIEMSVRRKENDQENRKAKKGKLTEELLEGNDNYKSTIRRKIQEVSDEIVVIENDILKLQTSMKQNNASKLNINEISEFLKKVGKVIPLLDKPAQQSLIRKVLQLQ